MYCFFAYFTILWLSRKKCIDNNATNKPRTMKIGLFNIHGCGLLGEMHRFLYNFSNNKRQQQVKWVVGNFILCLYSWHLLLWLLVGLFAHCPLLWLTTRTFSCQLPNSDSFCQAIRSIFRFITKSRTFTAIFRPAEKKNRFFWLFRLFSNLLLFGSTANTFCVYAFAILLFSFSLSLSVIVGFCFIHTILICVCVCDFSL